MIEDVASELLTFDDLRGAFAYNFLSLTVILFSLVIAIVARSWKILLIAAVAFTIVEQIVLFGIAFTIFGPSWKNSIGIFFGPAGAFYVVLHALGFAAYLFWCSVFFAIKLGIQSALRKSQA